MVKSIFVGLFLVAALVMAQSLVSVDFKGTCIDTEDGDISDQISWESNVTGQIGTGANFSAELPEGSHVITATCVNSEGGRAQISVGVLIDPVNPPSLTVELPVAGCVGDGCP